MKAAGKADLNSRNRSPNQFEGPSKKNLDGECFRNNFRRQFIHHPC